MRLTIVFVATLLLLGCSNQYEKAKNLWDKRDYAGCLKAINKLDSLGYDEICGKILCLSRLDSLDKAVQFGMMMRGYTNYTSEVMLSYMYMQRGDLKNAEAWYYAAEDHKNHIPKDWLTLLADSVESKFTVATVGTGLGAYYEIRSRVDY